MMGNDDLIINNVNLIVDMKKTLIPIAIVLFIIIVSLLNSVSFFWGIYHTPPNSIYLGTVHYYEDYFLYLNHFFQGAHGAWLTVNRYTPEPTDPSIIYWINILLGKLFGFVGIPLFWAYSISIMLLSGTFLVLCYMFYFLISNKNRGHAFIGLLFATLATSLINRVHAREGGMTWWPFQIWKTPNLAFDRLGGAPHQIIISILFVLLVMLFYVLLVRNVGKLKLQILTLVTTVFLATIQPLQALVFIGIAWLVILVRLVIFHITPRKPRLLLLTSLSIITGVVFVLMNTILSTQPHLQTKLWEARQHSLTTFPFLTLSVGPILVYTIVGILTRMKKLTPLDVFGILLILGTYACFLLPIPQLLGFSNTRILFPATYVFFGLFAMYGTVGIATIIHKKTQIRQSGIIVVLCLLFTLISLPTNIWELHQRLPEKRASGDPLLYLPIPVYKSFLFLIDMPYHKIVLANAATHMDSLVPALSGHTTFSGHMLATVENDKKQALSRSLFSLAFSSDQAKQFLTSNNISYILFTKYDGNRSQFEARYLFLVKEFETNESAVYRTQDILKQEAGSMK